MGVEELRVDAAQRGQLDKEMASVFREDTADLQSLGASARGSRYGRAGARRHHAKKAKADCKNDPETPKPRLSDQAIESSAKPSTRAVIFDSDFRLSPLGPPARENL